MDSKKGIFKCLLNVRDIYWAQPSVGIHPPKLGQSRLSRGLIGIAPEQ